MVYCTQQKLTMFSIQMSLDGHGHWKEEHAIFSILCRFSLYHAHFRYCPLDWCHLDVRGPEQPSAKRIWDTFNYFSPWSVSCFFSISCYWSIPTPVLLRNEIYSKTTRQSKRLNQEELSVSIVERHVSLSASLKL
jgi:hypothetical protein